MRGGLERGDLLTAIFTDDDGTYLTNNHTVSMSDYQMLVQCQAWQLSLIATMMFSCWKPIGSSYADGMRTIYMIGSP